LPTLKALRGFFGDVRRRRVARVLAIYAVSGWIVIQIAATVLPGLNVPDWSVTLVIVLVALGSPLAAVVAWAVGAEVATVAVPAAPATGSTGDAVMRRAVARPGGEAAGLSRR